MLDAVASPAGFYVLLGLFGLGMMGALLAARRNTLANLLGNGFAILGSAWGLLFASSVLATGNDLAMQANFSSFPFFSLSLHIDKLAAFFIGVISLIALFCSVYGLSYIKEYYKRYNIGALGLLYNAFILGMLLVVTAANGIWFLIAWEVMSLASYFLVVYDRQNQQNVKAGYVYLIMTHVGAACILLALALLFHYTHSFDFATIKENFSAVPLAAKSAVFALTFAGLGVKAGIIPLHIWLPSAHPAAPSHVSALMSGVMIKTGIYMMIRLFLDMFQPIPTWWGVAVLVAGAVSALVGVLYALAESDMKRLLAYSSIENVGIILLGLGSAMIFASLNMPTLELLALAAALFHTLNHATFKSLLFLSVGSVIQKTHTRNIEEYGGLLKLMPFTGLFFLVGSMAISALPPFNGFFSEWLTYQSLFGGLQLAGNVKWVFLAAAGSLAITGGLAAACFVKAFGAGFLARPRSDAAKHAKESAVPMRVGMAGLAVLCLVIGVLAGPVTTQLQSIGRATADLSASVSAAEVSTGQTMSVGERASAVSAPATLGMLAVAGAAVWIGVRYGIYRRQKVTVGDTWDCGTSLGGRMEITATGFARSTLLTFRDIVRPSMHQKVEHDDPANPYVVTSRRVSMHVRDVYQVFVYTPLYKAMLWLSGQVRRVQNGDLGTYVLYIFVVVIVTILVGA